MKVLIVQTSYTFRAFHNVSSIKYRPYLLKKKSKTLATSVYLHLLLLQFIQLYILLAVKQSFKGVS